MASIGEPLQKFFEFVMTCGSSGRDYPEWPAFEAKCKAEGLNDAAIAAFKYNCALSGDLPQSSGARAAPARHARVRAASAARARPRCLRPASAAVCRAAQTASSRAAPTS